MLALLLCLPWLNPAAASSLAVEARHPSTVDSEPGAIIHLAFVVHNLEPHSRRVKPQLHLPAGWRPVLPEGDFEIPPLSHQLRLISVQISASAPAGPAQIGYTVTDLASGQHQTLVTEVDVAAKDDLLLTWQTPPSRWLFQNHPEILEVLVTNTGNTVQRLSVSLEKRGSLQGMSATLSDESLVLQPGGRQALVIEVMAPDPSQRLRGTPRLAVVLRSAGSVYRLAHQFEPLVTHAEVDLYRRLPVEWQTGLAWSNGDNGRLDWLQTLSGSGHVDEDQRHHLSFFVRRNQAASHTRQSMIRQVLAYEGPWAAAVAGDFALSLSPLTGTGRLGRGVGLRSGSIHQPVRVGLHTLHMNTAEREVERAIDIQSNLGSVMQHQWILSQARGGIDHLASMDGRHHRWISSVLRTQHSRQHDWQFELASSRTRTGTDDVRDGQAWHFQSHGTLTATGRITYRLSSWHIDPDYAHPQRGNSLRHLNLNGAVRDGLGVRMHWQDRHIRQRAALSTYDQWLGMQVHWQPRQNWHTEVGHQWQRSRTGNQAPDLTRHHHVGLRRDWDKGSVSWRFNWRDGRATGRTFSARYRPHRRLSMVMHQQSSTRMDGMADLSFDRRSLWGRRLALQWQPTDTIALQLSYAERLRERELLSPAVIASVRQHSHGFRARLDYTASRHQRWWLETQRHQTSSGKWDDLVQAGWTMTWQVPIRRRPQLGSLQGHVEPIPSQPIRIQVGRHSTLSDPNGQFTLPALPSGRHRVQIDRSSLPVGRVADVPSSWMVTIADGVRSQVAVGLVPAASIQGRITLIESAWQGLDSVPPMVISLHHADHDPRHTVTDQQGRFAFDLLPPGVWTLEIDASQWPAGYHMKVSSAPLNLESGERRVLNLSLTPDERVIDFVDGGRLDE